MTTTSVAPSIASNRRYYLELGQGRWTGKFSFHMTDWRGFWKDHLGLVNRLLGLMMATWQAVFGDSKIDSNLVGHPDEDRAANLVRIHRFGITLYLLQEQYLLHKDGRNVTVVSYERFGPIPFLFGDHKNHPAEIHDSGTSSTYYMPLLGTAWMGHYQIADDKNHVNARLVCPWAYSEEIISRVAS
jgi:hypothetical protein